LRIQRYFDVRRKLINKSMKSEFESNFDCPTELKQAMEYALFCGGKRFRPMMLFAIYEMLKGKNSVGSLKRLMPVALALEFAYTGLLVHDELPCVISYPKRENITHCYEKYSKSTAVLVGDALITKSFEILSKIAKPKLSVFCIRALAYAISTRGIIAGQTVETFSLNKKIKTNVLKFIHLKRTVVFLQAIVEMACEFYGNTKEDIFLNLKGYAHNLGFAHEILRETVLHVNMSEKNTKIVKIDGKVSYPGVVGLDKSIKDIRKHLIVAQELISDIPNNHVLQELINLVKYEIP